LARRLAIAVLAVPVAALAVTPLVLWYIPTCSALIVIVINAFVSRFALLQSIQKLTNIVYLTRLDAEDEAKVHNYMTDAERELISCDEPQSAELTSNDQLEFLGELSDVEPTPPGTGPLYCFDFVAISPRR
jgi:hypothetical protein